MDKGSILVAKLDGYYVYGLILGIPTYEEHFSALDIDAMMGNLMYDTSYRVRDLLFGSATDFANGYLTLTQVPVMLAIFRSKTILPTKSIIKGFQKYSLFLTYDVIDNKVLNKHILTTKEMTHYQRHLMIDGDVVVEDSGLNIGLLYVKSCMQDNKGIKLLSTIEDYKKDLLPAIKEFREQKYSAYLDGLITDHMEDVIEQYPDNKPTKCEISDNLVYFVKTASKYYLYYHIVDGLYIEIGSVKRTSDKHNLGYFLSLLMSRDDFIMQEMYKPVKHHFYTFIERNWDKIIGIYPIYSIIVNDLNLQDKRLNLSEKDLLRLERYYGV